MREEWINSQIALAWKDRGAFPGVGAALEALGMRLGTSLFLELMAANEISTDEKNITGEFNFTAISISLDTLSVRGGVFYKVSYLNEIGERLLKNKQSRRIGRVDG